MQKLFVAVAAILVTGVVGAFSVPSNDAQDAERPRPVKTRIVEIEETDGVIIERGEERDGEWRVELKREGKPRASQAPGMPGIVGMPMMRMMQQAGTWQIATSEKHTLLLNTATGETFRLDATEGKYFWSPIKRPEAQRREMPRMPEFGREMPRREQLEEKLEGLRKKLKDTDGDRREQIKNAMKELEKALEKLGNREGDRDEADRDAGREVDELEGALEDMEEEIAEVEKRLEKTDSKRESKELEKALDEMNKEAKELRKELKKLRK